MTVEFTRESMATVRATLEADAGPPPPDAYLEVSTRLFGTEPISVERFISAEYQQREYDKLWSRVWQWACNKEDIPNVGDHTIYDIGDKSVLLVRVSDDEVKAYHNACLHRGRQLKTEPGNSRQLMCGFHGWTWNLDGSLAKVPCRWDFPQVTEDKFSLPEVRCESWSQFVFINFDDEAEPLLEALDVIPEHFAQFPLDDKFTAIRVEKVVPANWKVAMEAFLESYHSLATHPQIVEWLGDANTQYDVWQRSSRLYTLTAVASPHVGERSEEEVYEAAVEFFAAASPEPISSVLEDGDSARSAVAELTRGMMGTTMGLDLTKKSTAEVIDGVEYFVFPNWLPWSGVANALQYRFRPNGDDPHSCLFEIRMMYPIPPGAPRPPAAPLRRLGPEETWTSEPGLAGFGPVLDQDQANLGAVQRGLRATAKPGVNYGEYQESRIRHFHKLLDAYMAD